MAESSNKWFFDMIWDNFSELSAKSESKVLKNILDWLSKLFKWELLNETSKKQEELDALATDLIDEKINLTDKEISKEEEKILEKIAELDKSDKNIQNWFDWLNDIDDEDFVSQEKEDILSKLRIEIDDDNNKEWDLIRDEFKNISVFTKKKHDLCKNVLSSNNDKFKNLPDNLKTKKEIINSFNNVLNEKNWDIDKVTEDLIIDDLDKRK